jgi:hypothetical protein
MSRRKIQFFTSEEMTYDKYNENILGKDLFRVLSEDQKKFGEGCGNSVPPSEITIENIFDSFDNMDDIDAEIYDHSIDKISYYKNLNKIFKNMGVEAYIDDDTIEYVKYMYNPIIALDGVIISMGKLPDVFELLDAIEEDYKIF